MTIDKNRLKALAEEAISPSHGYASKSLRGTAFANAANPATILALLGEIERLERKNANQMESIREYQDLAAGGERLGELRADLRVTKEERDELKAERDRLQSQVATLQAEPNSYQSGYDAGQRSHRGTVDRVRAENDHLRNGMAAIRVASGAGDDPVVAHIAGLLRDAERYRWLRLGMGRAIVVRPDNAQSCECEGHGVLLEAEVDAAADADIAEEASHG